MAASPTEGVYTNLLRSVLVATRGGLSRGDSGGGRLGDNGTVLKPDAVIHTERTSPPEDSETQEAARREGQQLTFEIGQALKKRLERTEGESGTRGADLKRKWAKATVRRWKRFQAQRSVSRAKDWKRVQGCGFPPGWAVHVGLGFKLGHSVLQFHDWRSPDGRQWESFKDAAVHLLSSTEGRGFSPTRATPEKNPGTDLLGPVERHCPSPTRATPEKKLDTDLLGPVEGHCPSPKRATPEKKFDTDLLGPVEGHRPSPTRATPEKKLDIDLLGPVEGHCPSPTRATLEKKRDTDLLGPVEGHCPSPTRATLEKKRDTDLLGSVEGRCPSPTSATSGSKSDQGRDSTEHKRGVPEPALATSEMKISEKAGLVSGKRMCLRSWQAERLSGPAQESNVGKDGIHSPNVSHRPRPQRSSPRTGSARAAEQRQDSKVGEKPEAHLPFCEEEVLGDDHDRLFAIMEASNLAYDRQKRSSGAQVDPAWQPRGRMRGSIRPFAEVPNQAEMKVDPGCRPPSTRRGSMNAPAKVSDQAEMHQGSIPTDMMSGIIDHSVPLESFHVERRPNEPFPAKDDTCIRTCLKRGMYECKYCRKRFFRRKQFWGHTGIHYRRKGRKKVSRTVLPDSSVESC